MPSSVTVKSPSPNNNLIHVMLQTVDAAGDPVGSPRLAAVLDDGQEWTGSINSNTVVIEVEVQRNKPGIGAASPDAPEPAAAPPAEQEAPPAVIGGADAAKMLVAG